MATPMSARHNAGASFTPYHDFAVTLDLLDQARFLLGRDPGVHRGDAEFPGARTRCGRVVAG
ncbi:hypothetical protein [Amycolatopsis sp. NPDC102389]|uniref:hypothetical protein n=1 Tax=Amycolatopsis sp. NPDC102389 TaxID=3363941 RepID=UPI00382B3286